MANASRPKSEKPTLSVVDVEANGHATTGGLAETPAEQALRAVDHALAQIGEESRPLVLRSDVRRVKFEQDLREVEGLIAELDGRESLVDRVYAAAKASIASHRADLDAERALLQSGLSATPLARTEAAHG